MVLWKAYKGTKTNKAILDKVGLMQNSNTSNKFLVLAGFSKDKTEPHFASIIQYNDRYSIVVYSLMGNIVVTHWTEIKTK
jgi:hypothetical protein